MKNCILIGVAGGSGSGKTTVANNLVKAFKAEDATLLEQDAYYRELTNMTLEEKAKVNFDHPDSIEFELLKKHIVDLKNGKSIERPIYDFTTADEMILRRIERDMNERDRSFESVKTQYLTTVKPMYLEFCEPSKRYADVIIPRGGKNKIAIDMLVSNLKRYIEEK